MLTLLCDFEQQVRAFSESAKGARGVVERAILGDMILRLLTGLPGAQAGDLGANAMRGLSQRGDIGGSGDFGGAASKSAVMQMSENRQAYEQSRTHRECRDPRRQNTRSSPEV